MEKQIKSPECKRSGKNLFKDPDDVTDISIFHSKRSEKEYYFKCPHCGVITIFVSEPEQ